jgi:uncharacterized protein (TIGR00369 family)
MTASALAAALASGAPSGDLTAMPYAARMGITWQREGDAVVLTMAYSDALIGAPGRLHGGTLAGLLELAGLAAVLVAQGDDAAKVRIRPVTVTVDFMREGAAQATYASATIAKLGRRVVNVHAECWQGSRDKPIAAAHINFALDWPG